MTEAPIREREWLEEEEGEERSSPSEVVRNSIRNVREKLAKGGSFVFVVFFAIGLVFGISAKTLAMRSMTIGYWDYTVTPQEKTAVDLNAVQQKLLAVQADEAKKQTDAATQGADANAQNGDAKQLPPPPPAPPAPTEPPK